MSDTPPAGARAPGGPAIEATGLERRYASFLALRGVDLRLASGSTLALFGPNGAGKTTLLRILALVLRASRGSLAIFGRDPRHEPEAARAQLGFLSHETALYLDLDPEQNLIFTARLHGLDRPRQRAREALARVGLGDRKVSVRGLSRGLQQRAALARALLHEPRLLLLDEPWTGLDPGAQSVLRDRLAEHRERGGSAVITTHDLKQGYDSADELMLLARGRVLLRASRGELSLEDLKSKYREAAELSK